MLFRKKQKEEKKKDNFIYKITNDNSHNLELIRRIILNKKKINNLELFDRLTKCGFNIKYFNLNDIIGNINYGFCIIKLESKFILIDANYYKIYKNCVIKNPIIERKDGIKLVNRLIVYGFSNITNQTFNMYLNSFDLLKNEILLEEIFNDKVYRR